MNDRAREILRLGGEGILTLADLADFSDARARIIILMADGGWYTTDQIELAAGVNGVPARCGLRRAQELREQYGFNLEKKRLEGRRQWVYRLTVATPPPEPVATQPGLWP